MRAKLLLTIFLLLSCGNLVHGQPVDLLIPSQASPDKLSKELRELYAIERDIAIEKLTSERTKLDAYLELGELRLTQGKLLEAQRFFEMAIELDPKNLKANQGMTMVHYQKGEFDKAKAVVDDLHKTYPISDYLSYQVLNLRTKLKNEFQLGTTVIEDDKGLSQTISSIEGFFPSHTYRKMTGRYRFENWSHKENLDEVSSQVLSGQLDYKFDDSSSMSLTYAPEVFSSNETIGGFSWQAITGTDNLHMSVSGGKKSFKSNLFTIKNFMSEKNYGISLWGDLHKRTRIIQSVFLSDLSDGNSYKKYDTEFLHFLYRQGAPFLSLNLKISQATYEEQTDEFGQILNYWSPTDFKSAELTLSWERSVGTNWWWGIDTNVISNVYKLKANDTQYEKGVGALIHLSYQFPQGRLYASIGDRVRDYYRERKLEVYGSFQF